MQIVSENRAHGGRQRLGCHRRLSPASPDQGCRDGHRRPRSAELRRAALGLLERALRDEADAAEWRAIVRHLLGACPECRARAGTVAASEGCPLEGEERPGEGGSLGEAAEGRSPTDLGKGER